MEEPIMIVFAVWLLCVIVYGAAETAEDNKADTKLAETKPEIKPFVDYKHSQKGWF